VQYNMAGALVGAWEGLDGEVFGVENRKGRGYDGLWKGGRGKAEGGRMKGEGGRMKGQKWLILVAILLIIVLYGGLGGGRWADGAHCAWGARMGRGLGV
jgi:hypothetical protein